MTCWIDSKASQCFDWHNLHDNRYIYIHGQGNCFRAVLTNNTVASQQWLACVTQPCPTVMALSLQRTMAGRPLG
jgi:hypothetical protein